jgi:hypothetical protein
MLNDPSNNDPEFYASPTYNIHLITTFSPLLITLNLQKLIRPLKNPIHTTEKSAEPVSRNQSDPPTHRTPFAP